MVLELLIGVKKAEKKPWELLLYGIFYSSLAVLLGLLIFKGSVSMILVFLTVLACMPLMHRTLKYEEKKDERIKGEYSLLKEHEKALKFLIYMFLGFVISFSLWFIFLPAETSWSIFDEQLTTIEAVNSDITGGVMNAAAYNNPVTVLFNIKPEKNWIRASLKDSITFKSVSEFYILTAIIANNLKVLLFTLLFSLFYGAGAIFILTWNASVIGVAVGSFARELISSYVGDIGWVKAAVYFQALSLGLVRYLTHGVLEILAYFIVALAGGILGVAIMNKKMLNKKFGRVLYDFFVLVVIALLFLVIAAFVEVYITPALV